MRICYIVQKTFVRKRRRDKNEDKRFFESIVNVIKANKDQKCLLNSLCQGDMVWARMPLSNSELGKIKIGHRIRMYLVIWKDFGNIYAYQSSSKRKSELNNYEIYIINRCRYSNKKDSWIDLTRIVKVPVNKKIEIRR